MRPMQKTICELFNELNPYEKATFIDARLEWATNGALCGEITIRLCHPSEERDDSNNY